MGRSSSVAGTLVSAGLYAAAFPPLELTWAAWVALVPLLLALSRVGATGGFAVGLGWSLAVGLATSWWLPGMVADYFELGPVLGTAAALGAILATGVYYAVFGALVAWLGRGRVIDPLRASLLWGACEYGRTVSPFVANPWVLSGYSQAPFTTVVQMADVTGVVGVGMLLAAVNAAAAGWLAAGEGPRPVRAALATAACLLVALLYGGVRLHQDFGGEDPARVVLVQSAIPREQRFEPRFRHRNLQHHMDLVARAVREGAALVILPELAIDVPFRDRSREARALGRLAERADVDLLVGAPAPVPGGGEPRFSNSFFVLRDGAIVDRYDKVALTPFSETNPLRAWSVGAPDLYASGTSRRPLESRAGSVGILLCGESMFGAHAREAVRLGADILANPANDSWFGNAAAAHMQLAVARMRAIETRRPLLRPTMTGVTGAIDAQGRVVAELPIGRAGLLEVEVQAGSIESLYVRFGDWAGRVATFAAVACLLLGLREPRARTGAVPESRTGIRGLGVAVRRGPTRAVRSERPDVAIDRVPETEGTEAIG